MDYSSPLNVKLIVAQFLGDWLISKLCTDSTGLPNYTYVLFVCLPLASSVLPKSSVIWFVCPFVNVN